MTHRSTQNGYRSGVAATATSHTKRLSSTTRSAQPALGYPEATDGELDTALRLAAADDFVRHLPAGSRRCSGIMWSACLAVSDNDWPSRGRYLESQAS